MLPGMSIVTTNNAKAFPQEAAAASLLVEQAASAAGLQAQITQLFRFVPDNRIILRGTLAQQDAVFRMPLSAASRKQITREWAELNRTHPYMSRGPCQVACPLHFDEVSGLMVISHIPGTPLMKHLWTLNPEDRAPVYAHAGDWLAAYTQPSQSTRQANVRHWLIRARDAAAKQPHPALAEVETRVFRKMRHLSRQIGGHDWRVSIPHGDFHPNNLILNGQILTGIDTGGSSVAPIYKDMARSLTHMARRGLFFGQARKFGVDALAFDALAKAMQLTAPEQELYLPYLICFETLFRVEHPQMPQHRVEHGREMAKSLLRDLRQIT
ncbi:MAG: hypothetical protein CML69_14215 [Rhodobacteraceae bacterium]|nr:hypothetical protein [Paracoccaceae bacterium]